MAVALKQPGFKRQPGLKQPCMIFNGTSEYLTDGEAVPEYFHFLGRTEIFNNITEPTFKVLKPPKFCTEFKQCSGFAL
jgi:hypothetical protein